MSILNWNNIIFESIPNIIEFKMFKSVNIENCEFRNTHFHSLEAQKNKVFSF